MFRWNGLNGLEGGFMEIKKEPLQERPITKATAWKFVRISLYANFSILLLVTQEDLGKLAMAGIAFFVINFTLLLLQRLDANP